MYICTYLLYIYIHTYYAYYILFIFQLCTTASFNEILRSKLSGRSSASSTSAGSDGAMGCHKEPAVFNGYPAW